jgi:hypothetical protein
MSAHPDKVRQIYAELRRSVGAVLPAIELLRLTTAATDAGLPGRLDAERRHVFGGLSRCRSGCCQRGAATAESTLPPESLARSNAGLARKSKTPSARSAICMLGGNMKRRSFSTPQGLNNLAAAPTT